jgi:hypothetical protein
MLQQGILDGYKFYNRPLILNLSLTHSKIITYILNNPTLNLDFEITILLYAKNVD